MIRILPEPKRVIEYEGFTQAFQGICLDGGDELRELLQLRFWNYPEISIKKKEEADASCLTVHAVKSLEGIESEKPELLKEQGYDLEVGENGVTLKYETNAGFIQGATTIKLLLEKEEEGFRLPLCHITDYPSIPVRAIAQTFSWYAGYGRFGFDSQLWGYEDWVQYLNICLDNRINQFNLVMYGYWPFDLPGYPETVFRDVPIKIWNTENRRWLTVRYTHPNLEEPFMDRFIQLAHKLEVKIFAYVGLNSYNGAYTIKHPEARMKPPKSSGFLNDFDSLCLSYPGTVDYILESMRQIARLGFDGYTLEESEEGFILASGCLMV